MRFRAVNVYVVGFAGICNGNKGFVLWREVTNAGLGWFDQTAAQNWCFILLATVHQRNACIRHVRPGLGRCAGTVWTLDLVALCKYAPQTSRSYYSTSAVISSLTEGCDEGVE